MVFEASSGHSTKLTLHGLYVVALWHPALRGVYVALSGPNVALRGPNVAPYSKCGYGSRSRTQNTIPAWPVRPEGRTPPVWSVQYTLWRERFNRTVVSTVWDATLRGPGQFKVRFEVPLQSVRDTT